MGQHKRYWLPPILPGNLFGVHSNNGTAGGPDDQIEVRALRLADCLYVAALVTALDVFGYYVLSPLIGMWACYLVTFLVVSLGMVAFSSTVSRIHRQAEAKIAQQRQDLAVI